jgi:hypothetical protein
MEPVTFLLWLGGIAGAGVSAGALSKVGENIVDRLSPATTKVFAWLGRKLPQSKTVTALGAGQAVNYAELLQELGPVLADPELQALLAAARSIAEEDPTLKVEMEGAIAKLQPQIKEIYRDQSQKYDFKEKVDAKFIGGNHNHNYGAPPD